MKKLIISTITLAALTFASCKKDTLQPTRLTNTSATEQASAEEDNDDKAIDPRDKFYKVNKTKTRSMSSYTFGPSPFVEYPFISLAPKMAQFHNLICKYNYKDGTNQITSSELFMPDFSLTSALALDSKPIIRLMFNDGWGTPEQSVYSNLILVSPDHVVRLEKQMYDGNGVNLRKINNNLYFHESTTSTIDGLVKRSYSLKKINKKITLTITYKDNDANDAVQFPTVTRVASYWVI